MDRTNNGTAAGVGVGVSASVSVCALECCGYCRADPACVAPTLDGDKCALHHAWPVVYTECAAHFHLHTEAETLKKFNSFIYSYSQGSHTHTETLWVDTLLLVLFVCGFLC